MGLPELQLGIIPGYGGTQRLAKKINSNRALYYILTGEQIDATEAYRLGIVCNVYSSMNLLENGIPFSVSSIISLKLLTVLAAANYFNYFLSKIHACKNSIYNPV